MLVMSEKCIYCELFSSCEVYLSNNTLNWLSKAKSSVSSAGSVASWWPVGSPTSWKAKKWEPNYIEYFVVTTSRFNQKIWVQKLIETTWNNLQVRVPAAAGAHLVTAGGKMGKPPGCSLFQEGVPASRNPLLVDKMYWVVISNFRAAFMIYQLDAVSP